MNFSINNKNLTDISKLDYEGISLYIQGKNISGLNLVVPIEIN